MVPTVIIERLRQVLQTGILQTKPITGGDINQAYLVSTPNGNFFLKTNRYPFALQMFEAEAKGLNALSAAKALRVPTVLLAGMEGGTGFLLMTYHPASIRPGGFWEEFGASLAKLHCKTAPNFGFDHDNYIGTLPQHNCPHDNWVSFYIEERLLPQVELALLSKRLQSADYESFNQLFKRLPDICPAEPPALIHGDLWSGNFLCDPAGMPVVFDPAVSYSHREMDLAMTRLFGGFDREFYRAYEAAWPLAPGFEQRLPVYQLYYLMAHVNLFGGSYVNQVRSSLRQFI